MMPMFATEQITIHVTSTTIGKNSNTLILVKHVLIKIMASNPVHKPRAKISLKNPLLAYNLVTIVVQYKFLYNHKKIYQSL